MNYAAMTEQELDAIREHHDRIIELGMLELRAEQIRKSSPGNPHPETLRPIEAQMRTLDAVIAHLKA